MTGGWFLPLWIQNLLGGGGGGGTSPILHVHVTGVSTNGSGQYVLPAQASLSSITVDGAAHNHGDADLTVSGFTKSNLVNCTVSILTFPLGTFPPGDVGDFELMVTPSAYGNFSFRITVTSNDAGSPMVLEFVGVAVPTPDDSRVMTVRPRVTVSKASPRVFVSRVR